MRTFRGWGLVVATLALVCALIGQQNLFGKPDDGWNADRKAINAVLEAQEAAWNRGD